ncbi:MAG TPA: DUF3299 domain-containing protein [Opitutus sp.]|nr:DUF3299 domain-containing protein [Opitutus sp.]
MSVWAKIFAAAVFVSVAAGPSSAAEIATPEVENGYLRLGFDRLSAFTFVAPPFDAAADPKAPLPTGEEQIPEVVKTWSGKKAIVTGFMLPTRLEEGLVTEFLLVKDAMMCCYGVVPNMNEWVVVKLKKGVRPLLDVPVSFQGDFKVGALFENGYMTGIYSLEAEKLVETKS